MIHMNAAQQRHFSACRHSASAIIIIMCRQLPIIRPITSDFHLIFRTLLRHRITITITLITMLLAIGIP